MINSKLHNEVYWLELLETNNEEAFTILYEHYHKEIYVYLLQFVKIPEMAEDLVHEVFMKIWDIRHKLRIKISFSAYIYRIAHNKALDALRKISIEEALRSKLLNWVQLTEKENQLNPPAIHFEKIYLEAIAQLSPQRQKVFILCREKGKSYEEAALSLGISRNTVKEHMSDSLRILRAYLAGKGEYIVLVALFGTPV